MLLNLTEVPMVVASTAMAVQELAMLSIPETARGVSALG